MLSPVSTWMGDRLQAGKPSWCVASRPGQLSLAIPSWVGAMSTSECWDVNRHTTLCTSPISVVWQCKLVSGWGLRQCRSAPPYEAHTLGRTLLYCYENFWASYNEQICNIRNMSWIFIIVHYLNVWKNLSGLERICMPAVIGAVECSSLLTLCAD